MKFSSCPTNFYESKIDSSMIDENLIREANNLATGTDIHDVSKNVYIYRTCGNRDPKQKGVMTGRTAGEIAQEMEDWLREFVVRKKLEKHEYR